jgi:hypothetical protein
MADVPGTSVERAAEALETESPDVLEEVETTEQLAEELEDFAHLDEEDRDPVEFWISKQRDLVTSTVDYNLETLSGLVRSKTIDLSPRYQRRFRWNAVRQSKLIESFLMNVPIPPVFLNEDEYGHYSVIDGKQRIRAIDDFMRGSLALRDLKVFSDVDGLRFDELPETLQNVLKTRANLRAIIILRQSDPDIKFEVFQRLNTGGVRLNPQEIRNSSWPGPLNDLILELSEHPDFHGALGISDRLKSGIYREMRDAEFVLRFLTFRDTWDSFSGGMMRHMDTFMRDNQNPDEATIGRMRQDFLGTLEVVRSAFGDQAFRRWEPARGAWRRQVLAALFDAEMLSARGRDQQLLADRREQVLHELRSLFEEEEFQRAISAATNTPSLFKQRIRQVSELLDSVTR